ncbi:MAG: hypothetical protein KDB41_00115, partial [Propionibacteriaceae bacterium]|nr:hypothetical protein [Propionibacteriaceae bacterium]
MDLPKDAWAVLRELPCGACGACGAGAASVWQEGWPHLEADEEGRLIGWCKIPTALGPNRHARAG